MQKWRLVLFYKTINTNILTWNIDSNNLKNSYNTHITILHNYHKNFISFVSFFIINKNINSRYITHCLWILNYTCTSPILNWKTQECILFAVLYGFYYDILAYNIHNIIVCISIILISSDAFSVAVRMLIFFSKIKDSDEVTTN